MKAVCMDRNQQLKEENDKNYSRMIRVHTEQTV